MSNIAAWFKSHSRTCQWVLFLSLVLLPLFLTRSGITGVLRPAFLAASEIALTLGILIAIWADFAAPEDPTRDATPARPIKYAAYLAAVFWVVPLLLVDGLAITRDIFDYKTGHSSLRVVTATIGKRTGLPVPYLLPDTFQTDTGLTLTLPYSDMPRFGTTAQFTLLPTQDIVLYYTH